MNSQFAAISESFMLLPLLSLLFVAGSPATADLYDRNAIQNTMGQDYADGVVLQNKQKHLEAVGAFSKAISNAPKGPSSFNLLFQAYQMRANSLFALKKFDDALKDADLIGALLNASPDKNDKSYLGGLAMRRAEIYDAMGRNAEALQQYKLGAALKNSSSSREVLAKFYQRQGQNELAIAELRAAKSLISSSRYGRPQAENIDKMIEKIESTLPKRNLITDIREKVNVSEKQAADAMNKADLESRPDQYKLAKLRSHDFVSESIVLPEQITSVELTSTAGEGLSLAGQHGTVTVLSFLSTSESVSSENISFLNSLRSKYPASKLRIIGFLINRTGADPKQFFAKTPPAFPLVATFPKGYLKELTKSMFAPYVLSVPSNLLLDKSGMMVWRSGGWTRSTIGKTSAQLQMLLSDESTERKLGSD